MRTARVLVAVLGCLVPYLARGLRGTEALASYLDGGVGGVLFLSAFNAIAWGGILAVSFLYRYPAALGFPALAGFGFLGWEHYALNLAADAQAGVAIVFIPLYALPFIAAGGAVGYLFDWRWRRSEEA